MTGKTYTKKFNAQRAAKSAEKKGLHLQVVEVAPGQWTLETINVPAEPQTESAPEPEATPKPKTAGPATVEDVKAVFAEGLKAKASKPRARAGKRAAIEEAARRGEMPAPPDFSAATHKPYRKKLAELVALAEAGDLEGLRNFPIKPYSSSPKAMDRYRNLCVMALEAREVADA